jgi:hypothetical protein
MTPTAWRNDPNGVASAPVAPGSRRLARLLPLAAALLVALGVGGTEPVRQHAVAGSPAPPSAHTHSNAPAQMPPDIVFTFEGLLGHHATLVARLMRAELREDPDFLQAAGSAVVANTEELAAGVASVHGSAAGDAFRLLWGSHVDLFFDYAAAVAEEDRDGREEARAGLDRYRTEWGLYIEGATAGAITADAASENLRVHIEHLLGHADAYADGDYPAAFAVLREAFGHMFPTGRALAGGLAATHPGELPVPVETPSQQLRSTLAWLLGEHFELAVDAMRSGVAGLPDFDGLAAALNANTQALTQAVDTLVGPDRAVAFNQAWANHIDALVDYSIGLAEGDSAARQAALGAMQQIRGVLATAFSELTGGLVTPDAAAAVLAAHDDQLVRQIAAYTAADYSLAHELSNVGYHHMFDTAAVIASAIEASRAPQLPVGAPQTGGGGAAENGAYD